MMLLTWLFSFSASAVVVDRPPRALACVATDERGGRDEFELQFHSSVRRFNLFELEGSARVHVGPLPLVQIRVAKAAFGLGRIAYEVRLGTRGDADDVVEVRGGFYGRFGEAKVEVGSLKGFGFEVRVGSGSSELHLVCAKTRDA